MKPEDRSSIHEPRGSAHEADGVRPIGLLETSIRAVVRQISAFIGLILIILSVPIGILTPFLPVGLPIGIAGVVLLGRNSAWGKAAMERVLARYPKLERFAPNWLMKAIFGREKRVFAKAKAE